jgi:tetratricopeptide (TPR) repeat protein
MVVGRFLTRKWQQIKLTLWVLLVVLALCVAVAWLQARRHAQLSRGFAELKKAENIETLDAIARDRAGTRVGELASLKTARRLYDEGKYEQAAARFAQFCEQYPGSTAVPSARLGEAYALETAGKHREASQRFMAIAGAGGDSAPVRDAMCGAARCAVVQGLLAEAEAWYTKARDLAGTSTWDKDRIETILKGLASQRAEPPGAIAPVADTGGTTPAAAAEPAAANAPVPAVPAEPVPAAGASPAAPAGQAPATTPAAIAK